MRAAVEPRKMRLGRGEPAGSDDEQVAVLAMGGNMRFASLLREFNAEIVSPGLQCNGISHRGRF
jgi:hypothetical protein